jgi:N-acetylmuramoyl-L-alanine amidase
MTASVILETGFLTSPGDRELIVDQPELSAEGLADGIVSYLTSQNLL